MTDDEIRDWLDEARKTYQSVAPESGGLLNAEFHGLTLLAGISAGARKCLDILRETPSPSKAKRQIERLADLAHMRIMTRGFEISMTLDEQDGEGNDDAEAIADDGDR